jgi:hypothetical protein
MKKETELIGKEFATDLISSYVNELHLPEFRKKYSGRLAIMAGVCARILGLEDLVSEYESYIKLATPEDLKLYNKGSNKIKGIEEIDKKFPMYSKEKIIKRFISHDSFLKPCLTEDHEHARTLCKSELDLEWLACAQLVLGQFDEADNTADLIVEDEFRVESIREIKTIELWRYGHHNQVKILLGEVDKIWVFPVLALGFLNREPWQPYPFPDW